MQNNPLAGPAHVVALANALELDQRPGAYARPPVTGGEQISVRLSESTLAHLDIIGKRSGWTRVQVLTALIDRGLFDLYDALSDEVGESIAASLSSELAPTHEFELPARSLMAPSARDFTTHDGARRVLTDLGEPGMDGVRGGGASPEEFMRIDVAALIYHFGPKMNDNILDKMIGILSLCKMGSPNEWMFDEFITWLAKFKRATYQYMNLALMNGKPTGLFQK